MDFHDFMEGAVWLFELAGVAIFALGSLAAAIRSLVRGIRGQHLRNYEIVRRDIGRSILLGLEVLIIADIIETITVDLSLESAATLAIIVLVRTFLSPRSIPSPARRSLLPPTSRTAGARTGLSGAYSLA